ncbi:MAG: permease [Ectobacillus sp.]
MVVSRFSRDLIGWLLLALFLFLFFFIDFTNISNLKKEVPSDWLNVNAIFLSIFLEAIPFVLLGVFVSAIIQTFVSEDTVKRILPKSALFAVFPAALAGIFVPMCECAIVPIVRRLIQKGMPTHIGMVILVSTPILNPVVFASTYYAFRGAPHIAYYRMGLAFLAAVAIGFVIYALFRKQQVIRNITDVQNGHIGENRLKETLYHAADEFFDTGKYLLIGAFLASLFQTFLDREMLTQIGSSQVFAPVVMMGFGYVLSLCSEADAFIAASLQHAFTDKSLLAFLIFGPMIDFKNTLMLLAYFKKRFVLAFIWIVTVTVYTIVQLFAF